MNKEFVMKSVKNIFSGYIIKDIILDTERCSIFVTLNESITIGEIADKMTQVKNRKPSELIFDEGFFHDGEIEYKLLNENDELRIFRESRKERLKWVPNNFGILDHSFKRSFTIPVGKADPEKAKCLLKELMTKYKEEIKFP